MLNHGKLNNTKTMCLSEGISATVFEESQITKEKLVLPICDLNSQNIEACIIQKIEFQTSTNNWSSKMIF